MMMGMGQTHIQYYSQKAKAFMEIGAGLLNLLFSLKLQMKRAFPIIHTVYTHTDSVLYTVLYIPNSPSILLVFSSSSASAAGLSNDDGLREVDRGCALLCFNNCFSGANTTYLLYLSVCFYAQYNKELQNFDDDQEAPLVDYLLLLSSQLLIIVEVTAFEVINFGLQSSHSIFQSSMTHKTGYLIKSDCSSLKDLVKI